MIDRRKGSIICWLSSVRARCRADASRTRRQAVPQGAAQVLSMAATMRWMRLRTKGIAR